MKFNTWAREASQNSKVPLVKGEQPEGLYLILPAGDDAGSVLPEISAPPMKHEMMSQGKAGGKNFWYEHEDLR
jgi:hypothetical protein